MRILLVHERYQRPGGEDVAFETDVKLLHDHGHDVRTLVINNDAIPDDRSLLASAKLALNTVWSLSGLRIVEQEIIGFHPEIVHFNNIFPLISPSAYTACRRHGVAVVQSLHNYRHLCPNAILYRDGHTCEECLGRLFQYPAVIHSCYRGSRSQSAIVATMNAAHKLRGTWTKDVDRFIVWTRFERDKVIEGGFPAEKIVVKPNFVYAGPADPDSDRKGLLYAGRLTQEKGIPLLLDAWRQAGMPALTIAGNGPMADKVRDAAKGHPTLTFVGQQPYDAMLDLMRDASLLVMTSGCYETFGRVVVEAYAVGTPVLAPNAGAVDELVIEGVTGLHFSSDSIDDLAEKLQRATETPEKLRRMGENARREYERRYTPDVSYPMLMTIYEQAIDERAGQVMPAPQSVPIGA